MERTYDIISDAQFGFRPGMSTINAMFTQHSIITKSFSNKKRLYCCFVDFQKAFDRVDRINLWFKLSKLGIRGKLLKLIKSLYGHVKSCVSLKGRISDFFDNEIGLFQGEILSPILFSLYVNDFESFFISHCNSHYEFQDLSLFLMLYADDMVLFSETVHGLQDLLNNLEKYSDKWKLTVNTEKTKVVVFRKGGIVNGNEKWTYHGRDLDVVNEFIYLGIKFKFNNKFNNIQNQLSIQGRKAMFALFTKCNNMNLNVETLLHLFDTYVGSILSYGCEVWGASKANDIEKVHTHFCKRILHVKKSTSNSMVYCELGRFPLEYYRKYRMIKYWFKLITARNCILNRAYVFLRNCNTKKCFNWVTFIKKK